MEIKHKKIYILLVPLVFFIGFLYNGFASIRAWEGDLFFIYIQSKEIRFFIYGLIGGYMAAAVMSGSFLVFEHVLDAGKVGLLMILLLAGFCVGMVTLIPCYFLNLFKYMKAGRRKWHKVFGAAILIFVVLFFLIFLWIVVTDGRSVGERKVHQATIWKEEGTDKDSGNEERVFYNSAQNAVNAFWSSEDIPKLAYPDEDNEIIRFSDEDGSLILWASESIFDTAYIIGFSFEVRGELYSFPEDVFWQEMDKMQKRKEIYNDSQRVVRDIVASCVHNLPVCFGICLDDDMEKLSIMGKNPDGIKEFEYNGKTYHLWYFIDGSFIQEKIKENKNFKDLSMNEAVKYLGISF